MLIPHPETHSGVVCDISTRILRKSGGTLVVTYILEGDLDRLRIPAPRPPRVADELWRHTCCEIFIARKGVAGYHEFNLAPSGEWAAYAFERYRERAAHHNEDAGRVDPQIAVRRTANRLELDALIPLDRLSPLHVSNALSIALSVVVEDQHGLLSYWALRHPPGKPDFHHAEAFALELE